MSETRIPMERARRRLAAVWFFGFAVLFGVVAFQILIDKYGKSVTDAVAWFLPTVAPISTLMIGVFLGEAVRRAPRRVFDVDRFFYRLTLLLMIGYLLLVAVAITIASIRSVMPVEVLERSNLFLGPAQALVTAALGAFFVQSQEAQ